MGQIDWLLIEVSSRKWKYVSQMCFCPTVTKWPELQKSRQVFIYLILFSSTTVWYSTCKWAEEAKSVLISQSVFHTIRASHSHKSGGYKQTLMFRVRSSADFPQRKLFANIMSGSKYSLCSQQVFRLLRGCLHLSSSYNSNHYLSSQKFFKWPPCNIHDIGLLFLCT